ncbi:serine--tRNA ligase [candidate division KSB1 bacterium]|nr:MAG: serine--tRNA ligase [candidate division KSB1 bacterium]RPH94035.1 MAG: serine--tRNA ligase [candidate division KSB1 bacterium]
MLDIKYIREFPDHVRERLLLKGENTAIVELLEMDVKRRALIDETDQLKARRNAISRDIAQLAKSGQDASSLKEESRSIGDRIVSGDEELRVIETRLKDILARLPNLPHESVPVGQSAADNVVCRESGESARFDFTPRDHLLLAESLKILDFPGGTKITGSGFPIYRGPGATFERALINFMLDTHRSHGKYSEISTPFVVNRASLFGTGQLPKFEEDLYHCEVDDLFLIPTAEVPITNYHRDELLAESDLPIYYCGYSACFRREAGSYGKETRGFLRVHQFDKVELVKFVLPESSYEELELLVNDAASILEAFNLRYRVVSLCTGDLSFGAAKCYDLEVWAPVEQKWLEVSSCSNFEAFQARRANIRFRRKDSGKPEFVHTLNGSGLATSRLLVALLESNQNDDGTVTVPPPLRKYTGFSLITPDGVQ